MSNPLSELQRLLTRQTVLAGKVVFIASGAARVATSEGVKEVPADGVLKVGDQVTLRDGRAVKVQEQTDIPVYFV